MVVFGRAVRVLAVPEVGEVVDGLVVDGICGPTLTLFCFTFTLRVDGSSLLRFALSVSIFTFCFFFLLPTTSSSSRVVPSSPRLCLLAFEPEHPVVHVSHVLLVTLAPHHVKTTRADSPHYNTVLSALLAPSPHGQFRQLVHFLRLIAGPEAVVAENQFITREDVPVDVHADVRQTFTTCSRRRRGLSSRGGHQLQRRYYLYHSRFPIFDLLRLVLLQPKPMLASH